MNSHNKETTVNVRVTPAIKKQLLGICSRLDRSQGWVISNMIKKEHKKVIDGSAALDELNIKGTSDD